MAFLTQHTKDSRGFTLVEMLVVLAIITIITTVTLLSSTSFNRSVLLVDTAHTVALSIREAQFFGLSTRVFSGVSNAGYGIHFDEDLPNMYTLFADIYPEEGDDLNGKCPGHTEDEGPDQRPGNCLYDISNNEKSVDYTLAGNFTIASVCGSAGTSNTKCLGDEFDTIDIVFLRPNTETIIVGTDSGGQHESLHDACIIIRAPSAGTFEKMIYVSKVGQVAVVNECP